MAKVMVVSDYVYWSLVEMKDSQDFYWKEGERRRRKLGKVQDDGVGI